VPEPGADLHAFQVNLLPVPDKLELDALPGVAAFNGKLYFVILAD
jgi:hypothetical protein